MTTVTPELRAQIAHHIRASTEIRHGMILRDMERGLDAEQIASSQRTRDALPAKRARGERLGAAPAPPVGVIRRIITERREGRTFQAIAEGLMADAIPSARGKTRWYAATIRAVVTSDNAAARS